MKSIRVNYKLPPWMDEQIRKRAIERKISLTKYVKDALLRRFEWEDRNKKEEPIHFKPLDSGDFFGNALRRCDIMTTEEFKKRYPSK